MTMGLRQNRTEPPVSGMAVNGEAYVMGFGEEPPLLELLTQSFIDDLAEAGIPTGRASSAAETRALLADIQCRPAGRPDARVDDAILPVGPRGSVRVRIVRPRNRDGASPMLIFFPGGGGWLADGLTLHDRLVREIAIGAGIAVVLVDFGGSPEDRFPFPVEQAYAATKYMVEEAATFGLDGARMAIAGDGTGGTIAAAVTLLCKAMRTPKPIFQLLFYPVLAARCESRSYRRFRDGPWLTAEASEAFWSDYLPNPSDRDNMLAAPINAAPDQMRGLPETLLITAENDVVCDEGEAYARKLGEAGVRVTCTRYLGTIHDFVMLNPIADTPAARGAIGQAIAVLRTALE